MRVKCPTRGFNLILTLVLSIAFLTASLCSRSEVPRWILSSVNAEYYEKEFMPDFGQHSQEWCWVAAAANSFYWWAQNGYPELLDDPTQPSGNGAYENDIVKKCPNCPSSEGGYLRLLEEICKSTWHDEGDGVREAGERGYDFCQPVGTNWDYLCGLRAFISKQGVNLEVTEKWGATFDDYKEQLKEDEVAILWVRNYGGSNQHHYVTGASYDDVEMEIGVSDPLTARHNNDPTRGSYDTWKVTSVNPFRVEIPSIGLKSIGKIIYISPPFMVSNLTITPERVGTGETVSIIVDVKNIRNFEQTYEIVLKINGIVESTENVTLTGGATGAVTFTVSKDVEGTYDIKVGGLTGTFTVIKSLNWPLIIGIVGAVVIIGIIAALYIRRRKLRKVWFGS